MTKGAAAQLLERQRSGGSSHCLYMSEGAREAFIHMIRMASIHKQFVADMRGEPGGAAKVRENWEIIMDDVPRTLIEGTGAHVSARFLEELGGHKRG